MAMWDDLEPRRTERSGLWVRLLPDKPEPKPDQEDRKGRPDQEALIQKEPAQRQSNPNGKEAEPHHQMWISSRCISSVTEDHPLSSCGRARERPERRRGRLQ